MSDTTVSPWCQPAHLHGLDTSRLTAGQTVEAAYQQLLMVSGEAAEAV